MAAYDAPLRIFEVTDMGTPVFARIANLNVGQPRSWWCKVGQPPTTIKLVCGKSLYLRCMLTAFLIWVPYAAKTICSHGEKDCGISPGLY